MKKSALTLSFLAMILTTHAAQAMSIHCIYEHGETLTYNEKSQRLTVVDPHSSHPKVETILFNNIQLTTDGTRGADGKLNALKLIDSKNKTLLDVQRGQIENSETGEMSVYKSTWDVGYGKLVGGCSLNK
jgi:hypothetical protein